MLYWRLRVGFKFTDYSFYLYSLLVSRSEHKLNTVTGPDEMNVAGKAMGSHGAIGATFDFHSLLFAVYAPMKCTDIVAHS
eukprot:SAG31_NODE_6863_length_1867_cov_1.623869_2_plen_80_part_00